MKDHDKTKSKEFQRVEAIKLMAILLRGKRSKPKDNVADKPNIKPDNAKQGK